MVQERVQLYKRAPNGDHVGRSDSGRTVTLKNSRNDHNLFYGKEVKADVNTSTPVWKQNVDKWK